MKYVSNFNSKNKSSFVFVLLVLSMSMSAQESLFKRYLSVYNEAAKTKNTDAFYKFESSLTSDQKGYIFLKNQYYNGSMNQEEDPCKDVRSQASRLTDYSALIFTAKSDFDFFLNCELWNALRYNTRGRSKDEKLKGIEILKKVANQGYADAQYNLGMEYGWFPAFKELNLEENLNEHLNYLKMAAAQNFSDATYRVALAYEYQKDYNSAVNWLKKAIVDESDQADLATYRWSLAEYYEKGLGVEKNLDKALSFYKSSADMLAASINSYEKTFTVGVILYEGTNSFQRNRELGLEYIRKAARSGLFNRARVYCDNNNISY